MQPWLRQRISLVLISLCAIFAGVSCDASSSPDKTMTPDDGKMFAGYARKYANDSELGEFLKQYAHAVQAADWPTVLTFFDEDNFKQQTEIGIGQKQYIIEGMDLPMAEFAGADGFVNLNRLHSLVYHVVSLAVDDCYAVVTGDAILDNGRTVPFCLRIIRHPDGKFAIAPPLG